MVNSKVTTRKSFWKHLARTISPLPFVLCNLAALEKKGGDWRDRRGHRELGVRTLLNQRALVLQCGPNYRDLGGLIGAGGRRVAMGRFYRGDELGWLTDADLASLAALRIRTVVDFRTVAEAEDLPDHIPGSVLDYHHLPIIPGNFEDVYRGKIATFEAMERFVLQIYENLVTDQTILNAYRRLFSFVQDESSLPLLFHCAAGKDRTGLAAAFILLALGVDREVVMDDYLASNICLDRKYGTLARQHPELEPGLFAHRAYLDTAFTVIERDYGSLEAFLTGQLDIDMTKLRANHLE